MIQIYCPKLNPRIQYIFTQVLQDFMGISIELTNDLTSFLSTKTAKIAYSLDKIPEYNGPWIQANSILFEEGISNQELELENYQNIPCFFKSSTKSLFPFDWLAASFYFLSRYEEYQNSFAKDEHHRFIAAECLAVKKDFLRIPVVDYWCMFMQEILQKTFPELSFKKKALELSITVDIDHFYAYKNKPYFENLGRISLSFIKGNWKKLKQITGITFLNHKDPFDYFDQWERLMKNKAQEALFFVYCGQKGPNDPAFEEHPAIFQKIQQLMSFAKLGIHPSYSAFENTEQSLIEKKLLEKYTTDVVTKSRQHFIRLSLPKTYQTLEKIAIQDDYTMGYPTFMGFRAGTAQSFRFYNLNTELTGSLNIHPFQITDISLFLGGDLDLAMKHAREVISHIRMTNQKLCILCHSHALQDRMENSHYFTLLETLIDEYSSTSK